MDFYSGIVYEKLGIEPDLFTPVFAMARVVGWLAHWLEQLKDNELVHPKSTKAITIRHMSQSKRESQ